MIRTPRLGALGAALALTACVQVYPPDGKPSPSNAGSAQASAAAAKKPDAGPFKPWDEVLKDSREIDGYFKTHLKRDNTLFMEVAPGQLEKDFGMVLHLSRGVGVFDIHDGLPLSDMQLMQWRRTGDKLYLVHMNPRFTAAPGSPMKASLDDNVGNSIVAAFKIESENPTTKAMLVDVSSLVISDYPGLADQLKFYYGMKPIFFDKDRSYVGKVMGFPKNVEIDAELTFRANDYPIVPGSAAGVSDVRSVPVGVRYSIIELPQTPMTPRIADDRVGHFMDAVRDFSRDKDSNPYVRYVNRWRLEKKDPAAALSEPVQPIVYYVDRTVPVEYRQYVKEGIEGWQKAFEAAGFKNAIIALDAPDDTTWSAEDLRYSTVRWTAAHQMGYAIGPSETDPRTGEILNADVLVSSTWASSFNSDYQDLVGPNGVAQRWRDAAIAQRNMPQFMRDHFCMEGVGMEQQLSVAHAALAAMGLTDGASMPKEFLGAAIRDLVFHEVGHTLGLRHNFKATSAITPEHLNDKEYTRKNGIAASVMDYTPVNIALDPKQQGWYFNQEVGAYDVWAIQYAYAPVYEQSKDAPFAFSGKLATTTEAEMVGLGKLAAEASDPLHAYNTDEDTHLGPMSIDPNSSTYDLSDPLWYGRQRSALVDKVLPRLDKSLIAEGEGYQKLRSAVNAMLFEKYGALLPVTKTIGGIYFSRDHKGDPNGRLPFTPVSAERQREAVKLIVDEAFSEKAFHVPAEILNKLPPNRFGDWSVPFTTSIAFPIHETVGTLQGWLLEEMLDNARLQRMIDNEVRMPDGSQPYTVGELFHATTDAIWSELSGGRARPIDSYRRNLQRAYIDEMTAKALNLRPYPYIPETPEDARSLARMELTGLSTRIRAALENGGSLDASTRAHLSESKARIDRALDASLNLSTR